MAQPPDKPLSEFAIIQLLPNILTITAICAGLTAIRFGVQENYVQAVQLILAACVLDGLDGRLARALGTDSNLGAELDSLADFVNFGVAPPLVIYFWALQDLRSIGWISVLFFSVCCVVRLARFNVTGKSEEYEADSAYFTGVPAPAGALLVMLPMFLSFAFTDAPLVPGIVICIFTALIGLLMISRIPTWSFKTTRISRDKVKYFLLGFAIVGAAVLTYAWATMIALCLTYIAVVVWAIIVPADPNKPKGNSDGN